MNALSIAMNRSPVLGAKIAVDDEAHRQAGADGERRLDEDRHERDEPWRVIKLGTSDRTFIGPTSGKQP
jgi:hypothetical protein